MESKLYLNSLEAQKAQKAETAGTIAQGEKKPEKKEEPLFIPVEENKIAQGTPSGTPAAETAGTIAQGAASNSFSTLA